MKRYCIYIWRRIRTYKGGRPKQVYRTPVCYNCVSRILLYEKYDKVAEWNYSTTGATFLFCNEYTSYKIRFSIILKTWNKLLIYLFILNTKNPNSCLLSLCKKKKFKKRSQTTRYIKEKCILILYCVFTVFWYNNKCKKMDTNVSNIPDSKYKCQTKSNLSFKHSITLNSIFLQKCVF